MAINKVTYQGHTIMDITDSTVTPDTLGEGVIAYAANGEQITGTGSLGGGGNSAETEAAIIDGTISGDYTNDKVVSVKNNAFAECENLTSVSLPNCTSIGSSAFYNCTNLGQVDIPVCTKIGSNAFYMCYGALSTVILGSGISSGFSGNATIGYGAFELCQYLSTIELHYPTVAIAEGFLFDSTPIRNICVPYSLLSAYQNASCWSDVSSCIVALPGASGSGSSYSV